MSQQLQSVEERNQFLADQIVKFRPMILGMILTQIPDIDIAEDVYQEIYLTVCEKYPSFDPDSNFKAWVMRITKFKILSGFQRKSKDCRFVYLNEELLDSVEDISTQYEVEETIQLRRKALNLCLKELTDHQRKMLLKKYREHKKIPQIAIDLKITLKTAYVSLSRIRQKVRDCINKKLMSHGEAKP